MFINPPYEPANAPQRKKRRWKRSFRILGRFYITLSNCRVKKRATSGDRDRTSSQRERMLHFKGKMYEEQGGICPECGKHFDINFFELHHVLPWSRFPELRSRRTNLLLLCHYCHKEIHCNPWKNIAMMKAKAAEFGIDLQERYMMMG